MEGEGMEDQEKGGREGEEGRGVRIHGGRLEGMGGQTREGQGQG